MAFGHFKLFGESVCLSTTTDPLAISEAHRQDLLELTAALGVLKRV